MRVFADCCGMAHDPAEIRPSSEREDYDDAHTITVEVADRYTIVVKAECQCNLSDVHRCSKTDVSL